MSDIVDSITDFDDFAGYWEGEVDETGLKMRWQLLGELGADELLIEIPEWLAEEKLGYVTGSIPTEFIGRLDRETDKAILLADSSAAGPLMKLAHRIHSLETGLQGAQHDEDRREWLESRLRENREEFNNRKDGIRLRDNWIPKSQISQAVRRTE